MVASCQRFTHQRILTLKLLSGYVHRGTLPQSRVRSTAPSEREPGMGGCHSSGYSLMSGVGGRFSSPLRNSEDITLYHSTKDTPSVSLRSTAPSGREPGGLAPFIGVLANVRGWRAIFIAPTKGVCHSSGRPENPGFRAIFIAPTKGLCHSMGDYLPSFRRASRRVWRSSWP